MIAGKMSKSSTIGSVAAMDIPEVDRLVNAFFAGAKEVNPDIKSKVAFIGSFFDPPKAKEAALAQIDAGVDVIYAERFGVIEAAAEKKHPRHLQHVRPVRARPRHGHHRPGLGHVSDRRGGDQAGQGRRLHRAGLWRLLAHGQGRLLSRALHKFDKTLPADVKELVEKKKAEILEGNFRVDVDENTPVSD